MPLKEDMDESYAGRGQIATADMKTRIAALRAQGISLDDIIAILWERAHRAERGDGYTYDYFPQPAPMGSAGR